MIIIKIMKKINKLGLYFFLYLGKKINNYVFYSLMWRDEE